MSSDAELPQILRDIADQRRNAAGDFWSIRYCASAAICMERLQAENERLHQLLTAYQRAINRVDDRIEYAIPMPAESRSALYAILSGLSEEVAAIVGDAQ